MGERLSGRCTDLAFTAEDADPPPATTTFLWCLYESDAPRSARFFYPRLTTGGRQTNGQPGGADAVRPLTGARQPRSRNATSAVDNAPHAAVATTHNRCVRRRSRSRARVRRPTATSKVDRTRRPAIHARLDWAWW